VQDAVRSPSFVLIREHQGRVPFFHIDLYRLERSDEIAALGLDDYFGESGVCLVEWADRAASLMPREHLLIHMRYISSRRREIEMVASGHRHRELLSKLAQHLQAEGEPN
jgi:tRNA threonylcarbamoyladenosine biosynthesis protein TsaE